MPSKKRKQSPSWALSGGSSYCVALRSTPLLGSAGIRSVLRRLRPGQHQVFTPVTIWSQHTRNNFKACRHKSMLPLRRVAHFAPDVPAVGVPLTCGHQERCGIWEETSVKNPVERVCVRLEWKLVRQHEVWTSLENAATGQWCCRQLVRRCALDDAYWT
jgi:hypothetical protein